ncbi:SDR family oxidoreductase [Pontibacillus yanchengensis]|uniref:SDR family oxidoreductase n=2 Tax=Pontibacillus yanchengensis TaxID=462910 RepID=A0ACC7VCR8_9BACI|nr:oxidoreductase [Pontibacillus yanchengensis]MYL35366.1 SDR family oxidoreductase [Pontibacillus yanchengensis]MYL52395.1 SDR family oxidoreductase [Pontibacillus yanchengensis]
MVQKIAIVTGASSGFGLLITVELAKRGFKVYATMRNLEKTHHVTEAVPSPEILSRIHFEPLDVTKEDSINQFHQFVDSLERIDVLVNNAGYALGGFSEEITMDEYRKQFETNVFGTMAVIQTVLPTMRQQKSGRIINMSSISGLVGFPGISPYVASKHALEGYSESLRLELKPYGINVAIIEPGSFNTNIWSTGKQISEKSLQETSPYYHYMEKIEAEMEAGEQDLGEPQDVADLVASVAEKRKVKHLRYPVGKGVRNMIRLKKVVPWPTWESKFLKRLKL